MAHPGHHAESRPDDIALVMADSGATMTWGELRRRSVQAANTMHDLGVEAGDSIAFCVENRFEFAVLLWAAVDAGMRYTPISTRLTPDELAYIVADCDAKVFFHSARTAETALGLGDVSGLQRIVDIDEPGSLGESGDDPPRYRRAEGISMLYSSGTTGRPKGVRRPAPPAPIEELLPADAAMAAVFGITADSVYLSPAPMYHSAPLTFIVQMGRIGATTVIMERFDATNALAAIERFAVTHSQWVPTMFVRMLRLPEEVRGGYDLSSHVFAIHGAGPCSIATKRAMLDWWGPIIYEYYAGTEGAGMCLIGPEEWSTHEGSVGRSLRGPVLIVDDDGNELPTGETGQIWFVNSADFSYHNDPEKTAEARRGAGGTFGDIGYVDADGYLYLTDRKSFTINAGGINIYPREIEDVLAAHPAVHDVAVFGVPHDEYGEEVKAVVEPAPDVVADDALAAELTEYCRAHLAGFKVPRSIDFDPALPREQTGKLRTHLIRDRYLDAPG